MGKYGAQQHHSSKIGAKVHVFRTQNDNEAVEALLQDAPMITKKMQSKIDIFPKGKPTVAKKAWAAKTRHINLPAHIEDIRVCCRLRKSCWQKRPPNVFLQDEQSVKLNSIFDREISPEVQFRALHGPQLQAS